MTVSESDSATVFVIGHVQLAPVVTEHVLTVVAVPRTLARTSPAVPSG